MFVYIKALAAGIAKSLELRFSTSDELMQFELM